MNKNKKYIHQDLLMAVLLFLIASAFFIGSFMLQRFPTPVNNIHTFPQLASGAMIVFSFFNISAAWKKTKKLNEDIAAGKDVVPEISWKKLKYPLTAVTGILVYTVCVAVIGFFVSTAVFMVVAIYWLGYRKLWVILATTTGLELFIYILFVRVLYTRMPSGLLF